MAEVRLGRAILSLWADPAVQVVIPNLSAMSTPFGHDRAFVRFAGDTYPTAFRGEGRAESFALTCMFPRKDHDDFLALRTLLRDTAPSQPDSRLLLRTHAGLASGLNPAVAVEVDGEVVPSWTPAVITVSFTVRVVEHTFFA